MKADNKSKIKTFSISNIIKAKQKEFNTQHSASIKENNSTLTKTKDYSKEDEDIILNNFSTKNKNNQKYHKITKENFKKLNDFSEIKNINLSKPNFSNLKTRYYNKSKKIFSNLNNNSINSKNFKLEIKNIEYLLKYKDYVKFNDSKSYESDNKELYRTSNNNTYIISNSQVMPSNQKSKKTFSKIHKFKRSSISSKFLNLYLGDIKNISEDYSKNIMTDMNVNSFITTKEDQKEDINDYENFSILNISDSLIDYENNFSKNKSQKIKNELEKNFILNYNNFNNNCNSVFSKNKTIFSRSLSTFQKDIRNFRSKEDMSVINLFEFLNFSDSEKNFDNLCIYDGESEIFYNFPFGKKELKNP